MPVKVAALTLSNEKEWVDGKLRYHYSYPEMTFEECYQVSQFYLDKAERLIDQAGRDGAQMVCLPECMLEQGKWLRAHPERRYEQVERSWASFVERLSAAAQRNRMVVVAGALEPLDGKLYNAGAVFDDDGSLLGCYHKVQLAMGEEQLCTPGDSLPVFPTRHGNVGVLICWDIIFPEVTQGLLVNGADILFQPTYGHGGAQADFTAQTRAHDTCCPLVISMWNGNSRVIDKDGTILAKSHRTRDWQGIIPDQISYAEVEPRAPRQWIGYSDFKAGLLAERRVDLYHCLGEMPLLVV